MKSGLKIILLLFLVAATTYLPAQDDDRSATPGDEQLAIQYYRNGEFDKAVVLFQGLFNKNTRSVYYYSYYFDCLLKLKDYKNAESMLKKLVKKNPDIPEYSVDLGYLYSLSGYEKKSRESYDAVIKSLISNEDYITRTANAFMIRGETERALAAYMEGRKLLHDNTAFGFSVAEIYRKLSRPAEMVNEYLNIIHNEPAQIDAVQDRLQDYVTSDANYNKVKEILMSSVQKYDYDPDIVRLLSWLFIQKKDFESAFIQLKSIDKRYSQNNIGLIQLADICISNQEYGVASRIYKYIMDKGNETPYYIHAKYGLLDVSYLNLINQPNPDPNDIIGLETSYTAYLRDNLYQFPELSEKVILRLAEIKAIYLHKVKDAISLLKTYMDVPQLNFDSRSRMKLALGDYEVLDGDIWDATLLYSQVDYAYKNNPIGYEAKFRNAKLAFYRGDFEYAADLLDVLKASTSELIANDAIQLSLVIQENIGEDSNLVPLEIYAKADFFIFKNELDSAEKTLDTLLARYPVHSLADDAWFAKGTVESKRKNYQKALGYYEKVYTDYSQDILADDALFRAAQIYDKILNQPAKASELYEKIILGYPDSVFVVEARKRFREIRGS